MPIRVNDSEVKCILDTTIDTTPFIKTASILIDQFLVGHGLPAELLKEMERWWAAHLTAIRDLQPQKERTGEAEITYQGKTDMGLNATLYGQQVLTMDTTGILANIGNRPAKWETIQSPTEATPTTG